jgi:hypothetical protein
MARNVTVAELKQRARDLLVDPRLLQYLREIAAGQHGRSASDIKWAAGLLANLERLGNHAR